MRLVGWQGRKPQQTARLRTEDPLFDGMDYCAPLLEGARQPWDYWSKKQLTLNNAPTWVIGERGFGMQFTNATDGVSTGDQAGYTFPDVHSVFCIVKTPSAITGGTFPNIFAMDGGAAATGLNVLCFCRHTTNDVRFQAQNGGSTASWSAGGAMPTNEVCSFGFTYDGRSDTNDAIIYVNGIAKSVSEAGTPPEMTTNTTRRIVIGNKTAFNDPWQGTIFFVAHWNKILQPGEMHDLHEAWLRLLKERER